MIRALATAFLVGAIAVPAAVAQECATLADLEDELICPTCNTTLEMSNSPVADRMRAFIRQRTAECATKSEVKAELVAEFGEEVLAAPPARGFNVLAWALPLAGGLVAAVALSVVARRWRRPDEGTDESDPSRNGRAPLDPALERRVDEELARFDA